MNWLVVEKRYTQTRIDDNGCEFWAFFYAKLYTYIIRYFTVILLLFEELTKNNL